MGYDRTTKDDQETYSELHENAEVEEENREDWKTHPEGYTPLHISAQFGHKNVFKLLIEVYKADPNIRDYSGRTADYYFLIKEQKEGQGVTLRKIKGRKKQSDKDLGFLRIGSLNVRVKKTTEAFSNFLGVGSANVAPLDAVNEKILKGWGSADNISKEAMGAPKTYGSKKKYKKGFESGGNSTPSTPKTPTKNFHSLNFNDSDSDTAAGFDSNWKH
ncbi:ankyrin repeat domain-containing protein SOWAHA [Diabrotica virgifera virgifera]|uniref:Ankyrin repeat domain-containing protein SOWAHC-like n=1 Tax=Diabrotica virgifera virgifera TaxID=50390 RepID=A0ABM5KRQ6_DIAVI|nr:ankyrin repeat domain-containing protein SOWAHA [Diabrotica virgifera virgifera]